MVGKLYGEFNEMGKPKTSHSIEFQYDFALQSRAHLIPSGEVQNVR